MTERAKPSMKAAFTQPRLLDVAAFVSLRESAVPHALLDIRDPGEVERGHIFGSTGLPRRRIESGIAQLVVDPQTAIVVVDDGGGRAELTAHTLVRLGYQNVGWLAGGSAAWAQAGHHLATGSNVPSKLFGEQVHHTEHVPSIDVATFLRWREDGRDMLVCDVRTPGEYRRATIPGSVSAPSFDIALAASGLRQRAAIIVHCAGRTRSIVGTQTLRELGIDNVFALENGTMGWVLAGETLERGAARALSIDPDAVNPKTRARARALADASNVGRIDPAALAKMLANGHDGSVFDVRSTLAYEAGHIDGSRSVPGGQAVQRADDYVAVRQAPIVLIDDGDVRSEITAFWLKRMGYPNVAVLDGGLASWCAIGGLLGVGRAAPTLLGTDDDQAFSMIGADALADILAAGQSTLFDVDTSERYVAGHVPGAHWLPRGWLELRIASLIPDVSKRIVVTCIDGRQSKLAAATLHELGYEHVLALDGGTRAWSRSGRSLETTSLPPQDDIARAPYERGVQAMRDYLAWETALPDQAKRRVGVQTMGEAL